MAQSELTIPVGDVMGGLTLKVRITGVGVAKARLWLASRLMVVAAWVAGCGVEIEL